LNALKVQVVPGNLVPQAEFVARVGVAYKSIQIRQASHGSTSSTDRSVSGEALSLRRFGSEIALESIALDLMGRADWIDKLPDGAIRIVEYKTGSVRSFDADEPKEELWIQVGAYGLMAIEPNSATEVVLRIVTPDRTWDRVLSATLRVQI